MHPRLSLVTLGVADVARARRFYEALGWRASSVSSPDVCFFQLGGMALSLFGRQALADDAGVDNKPAGFAAITLAQNVPTKLDVDKTLLHAVAAGAVLVKPGQEAFWGGYSGYFADLDGHLWEIAWNPHFTLKNDGSLEIPT